MTEKQGFASLEDFWPFYLGEHRKKGNRTLHFIGSCAGLLCLALAIITRNVLWIPAGFIAGYGFAWTGHFFIEHNRPATFKHPLYSFLSDWRMFYCILTGKIDGEIRRFGLEE
jgi:hypothetical protein